MIFDNLANQSRSSCIMCEVASLPALKLNSDMFSSETQLSKMGGTVALPREHRWDRVQRSAALYTVPWAAFGGKLAGSATIAHNSDLKHADGLKRSSEIFTSSHRRFEAEVV
jgi:hypothetical protein